MATSQRVGRRRFFQILRGGPRRGSAAARVAACLRPQRPWGEHASARQGPAILAAWAATWCAASRLRPPNARGRRCTGPPWLPRLVLGAAGLFAAFYHAVPDLVRLAVAGGALVGIALLQQLRSKA